ncbi:undecaprenyldiphospho-muramoylpentapeptide beta-N-acetylglucosaminyltransferase [Paenibacillus polymyxa]|uniref:undecaprenyldiphospho-muramoylpentapeptide beta-N-acetylglucosaminyltransferase n=1 Tax=Paenibacillus polymyxa TaxID=1406 RepID=UPI003D281272
MAVARQCEEIDPDAEFLYIGGQRGLESKLVPQEKIPFEAIDITGFRRSLSVENIKTIMRFLKGVRRSKALLKKFKPDIVIGTGGYVCGPVVYAASKLGIPSIIHEQNAIPGLTNAFLSRYVDTVAVSFEGSEGAFPKAKNVLYTGNPRATTVRLANRDRGFATIRGSDEQLCGPGGCGSRGAKAINDAMIAMVPQLSQLKDVHFVYVTGESYYEQTLDSIRNQIGSLPNHLHVLPYIHNMPEVLACTSLIVNRAGASFLAEITSLGIPSILIPSPNVTNNHQEANARTLEKAGASVMITEKELSGPALFQSIVEIMKDEARRSQMAELASALGKPDSADILVKEMERLAHNR